MEARNLPRHMRAEITTYYSDIWTRHTGATLTLGIASRCIHESDTAPRYGHLRTCRMLACRPDQDAPAINLQRRAFPLTEASL